MAHHRHGDGELYHRPDGAQVHRPEPDRGDLGEAPRRRPGSRRLRGLLNTCVPLKASPVLSSRESIFRRTIESNAVSVTAVIIVTDKPCSAEDPGSREALWPPPGAEHLVDPV